MKRLRITGETIEERFENLVTIVSRIANILDSYTPGKMKQIASDVFDKKMSEMKPITTFDYEEDYIDVE